MSEQAVGLFILALIPISVLLYVLPSIIAFRRLHPNRWLILAVNVMLGATGIGWAVALVWACYAAHRPEGERDSNSPGGESGLNLFINDVRRIRLVEPEARQSAAGKDQRLAPGEAVRELERLNQLRAGDHLSEAEFTECKSRVLQRL
jgi:hypothetical protein